jgi:hypothetical protein
MAHWKVVWFLSFNMKETQLSGHYNLIFMKSSLRNVFVNEKFAGHIGSPINFKTTIRKKYGRSCPAHKLFIRPTNTFPILIIFFIICYLTENGVCLSFKERAQTHFL